MSEIGIQNPRPFADQERYGRAWLLPKREGPWVVVRRQKRDYSLGWHTWHFTRWGARRAARRFERTGKTRGFKP